MSTVAPKLQGKDAVPSLAATSFRDELRNWVVVLGTVCGLAVGNFAIPVFAFSTLLKPTSEATGLTRSDITFAYFIGLIVTTMMLPFYGRLVDRYGLRIVSVPAIIAWGISIAGFALLSSNAVWPIVLLYALGGLFSVAQTPLAYSKAIASWFGARRGFALGIGVSGVGLGGFLMPQFAQALNQVYGWRIAYLGLGLAVILVAVPVMTLLVNIRAGAVAEKDANAETWGGLKEAMRKQEFWILSAFFLFSIAALNGSLGHVVAMLSDGGMAARDAVGILSIAGIALIAGRILCGFLLDRLHGRYVTCLFMFVPMIALIGFVSGAQNFALTACALGLGIGIGGETDILGYLTSRYFKLSSYGVVYGVFLSLVTIGSGVGPLLIGLAHDRLGNYQLALSIAAITVGICAVLSLTLGPYPTDKAASQKMS